MFREVGRLDVWYTQAMAPHALATVVWCIRWPLVKNKKKTARAPHASLLRVWNTRRAACEREREGERGRATERERDDRLPPNPACDDASWVFPRFKVDMSA